jgi:hypothetical protein
MHTVSMRMTIDQIVEETREWPEERVAELVDRIYRAKYGDICPVTQAAWREEIQRRIADLESGGAQGIPLEETLARMRGVVGP